MSQDNMQAESAEEAPPAAAPDVTLAALYKSARPVVELVPGVALSALINACWLPKDAKAMLSESWIPVPAEAEPEAVETEEGAPTPVGPPSFDPAAIEYTELQKRLSRSAPLVKWNELMIKIKGLELEVVKIKDESEKEAKTLDLETSRAQLAETEAQLTELKASFQDDPLSLVPWMRDLFELADAGLTTFEVSGRFFPYTQLRSLFMGDNVSSYYEGPERVLGTFKKRYERERGPNKIQLLTKLVPNIFQDGYSGSATVEAIVAKMRESVFGPESTEPLDFVQLYWWDLQEQEVLPTLKALQRLTEDQYEVNEETGELVVTQLKTVKGIGLVDFPPRAIISAIQAGVPIVSVQIPFSIADRTHSRTLTVCQDYNLKVLARDGLMGGLISEKYVGAPAPDTTAADEDLDEVAYCQDLMNNYGGWDRVQALLRQVEAIATKHGVKMQTVALRWQIDHGTFPVTTTRWTPSNCQQFGYSYWTGAHPGLDWQLFQVESFLDQEDMRALNALGL